MADFRVALSDGVTTVNFYDGGHNDLQYAGLDMPTPRLLTKRAGNPYFDGFRIGASRYDNREITLRLKIVGTSLADLKTNERAIQRLLNDARHRTLSGFGNQVYLEIQWGDVAGESTFFDILQGSFSLPRDWAGAPMRLGYELLNTAMALECKPFGRYANQDIVQETLENSQSTRAIEDNYLVDDDSDHELFGTGVGATFVEAQTFACTGGYTAVGAAALIYREGLPGNVTFEIFATLAGAPTGVALATGTLNLDTITTDIEGDWVYIPFAASVVLGNGTVYALVIEAAAGNAANLIHWRSDSTAGYAGGTRVVKTAGAWAIDATDDNLFAIFSAETHLNYQDIATLEGHGDVPARVYWKLDMAGAAGDEKVWLAKRTGERQTDDLWTEGEDEDSSTQIAAANDHVTFTDEVELGLSNGMYHRAFLDAVESVGASTEVSRINFTLATPPRGLFRVLLRCRTTEVNDAAEYAKMGWGIGYSYGDRTKAPAAADDEIVANSADNTWETIDLGLLSIPPIPESDIAGLNSLELRVYQYALEALRQEYISPDATDAANLWNNPAQAWDDDTGTFSHEVPGAAAWTSNLDLGYVAGSVTPCGGVRVWIIATAHEPLLDLVDIDCYYEGAWHGLYQGVFVSAGAWEEFYFADGWHAVEAVRIRMFNNADALESMRIHEVDFLRAAYHWDLDYLFLLPVDEGVVILDTIAAADILAMDGITDPAGMLKIDGADDVVDFPDYTGRPFDLGRESTRLYVLRSDTKAVTFASDVKYQALFLVI